MKIDIVRKWIKIRLVLTVSVAGGAWELIGTILRNRRVKMVFSKFVRHRKQIMPLMTLARPLGREIRSLLMLVFPEM